MDLELTRWMQVAAAAGLVAVGFLVGILAARFGGSPTTRLHKLEQELFEERDRNMEYRNAVATHFGDTAERFRDLTQQYTSLYTHLAQGARDLCTDRHTALAHAFPDPALLPMQPEESAGSDVEKRSDSSPSEES